VTRHAQAKRLWLQLGERVEMAGGRFQLESRPGSGVVRATFDLPAAA
jgi:signal transduction histidine kinase